ncbi:hypothetical protein [Neomesorhizobium albiziae]|uniref:hypothetical protein n=1 Tax=Neomesorhizobium albiziae TaxID=335020 RepID=UPI00165F84D8|nr:hypothetical protein [Mesorhizobium albiziae]
MKRQHEVGFFLDRPAIFASGLTLESCWKKGDAGHQLASRHFRMELPLVIIT